MTVARSQLVDVNVTPWYHVISKTVRGASLLGQGQEDRKQWIEDRLEELSRVFAVEIAGFAVLDNHLHVLVRLCPELASTWTDAEVVRRWADVFPPRGSDRAPLEITQAWLDEKLRDAEFVARTRLRLADLGWFMKCLKEPLARRANREDNCRGAFWQGRYKSIAILDDEALLATCAYIDLNPVAAGIASTPEASPYTSVHSRIEHCREQDRLDDLQAAREGSVAAAEAAWGLDSDHWLCPLGDERGHGAVRVGVLEGLSLGSYLQLVDWTSRLTRDCKARVSSQVASILDRLGTSAEVWQATLQKLFSRSTELGVAFAFHRERLKEAAARRGCHHIANLNGCPA
jgi:REP element-mobilizing transposase RayT